MNESVKGLHITHWDRTDPRAYYAKSLRDNPVIYDDSLGTWIVYSYPACKSILMSDAAEIPAPDCSNPLVSEMTKSVVQSLARLTNNSRHTMARSVALQLVKAMQRVDVDELMESLLPGPDELIELDWVSSVCKKLPVLFLAKSLGFDEASCDFIVTNIGGLVKIISPNGTGSDAAALNTLVEKLVILTEDLIARRAVFHEFVHTGNSELVIVNILGLLIQSYDAGRGALCNTVMQLAARDISPPRQKQVIQRYVIETLRYDPPVHYTRRVAVRDIAAGGCQINKGQQLIVVLAAANLDSGIFEAPLRYDINRLNNMEHLTFGAGGHSCLARHLIVDLLADACDYLFRRFTHIEIPEQTLSFEPQLNVRLVKELFINLSN